MNHAQRRTVARHRQGGFTEYSFRTSGRTVSADVAPLSGRIGFKESDARLLRSALVDGQRIGPMPLGRFSRAMRLRDRGWLDFDSFEVLVPSPLCEEQFASWRQAGLKPERVRFPELRRSRHSAGKVA